MKIDCPHCGVLGSVDESFADKKLRCPKCRKVFLVPERYLSEIEGLELKSLDVASEDVSTGDDSTALMEAEGEIAILDEALDLDTGDAEGFEEDLFDFTEERAFAAVETKNPVEGDELSESDSGSNDYEKNDEDDVAIVLEEEGDDASDLEECTGCGDTLHPYFLETVGEGRYCALCVPEESAGDKEIEAGQEGDDDFLDTTERSGAALMKDDSNRDEDGALIAAAGAGAAVVAGTMAGREVRTDDAADSEPFQGCTEFSVGGLIKEAWLKTKGVKASIWGAVIFMYLIVFGLSFGGTIAFQQFYQGAGETASLCVHGTLQIISSWLSMLMTAGIMLIGVRHVCGQRVNWKMVFAGFTEVLSISIAMILMGILIFIGFLLLIIPGIYLSVGYALVLPLILDKGMGPWAALEASRKAIHKKWWTVFGLYLVMTILSIVSMIPLGLGLIWIVPMYFVLIGVLYVHLFGNARAVGEDLETENDSEEKNGIID